MIFPMETSEKKKAWQMQKKQLFEEVRISGNPQYWQGARVGPGGSRHTGGGF